MTKGTLYGSLVKSKLIILKLKTVMKKLFLFLITLITFSINAQITTAWTTTISASRLPEGATIPTVAEIDDANVENFSIDLDATTYDNATETTAFTAIGAATKTDIDSNWVVDVWALDTSLEITGRIVITSITRRFDNFEPNDLRGQYTEADDIYRVNGYFEWIKED